MNKLVTKVARGAALGTALVLAASGMAFAAPSPRAVTKSPAADGAYLARMPGFANGVTGVPLNIDSRVLNDGVVIRASSIQDGKIVIPPSGLYITIRSSNWMPFNNEPILLAGVPYRFITDTYEQSVIKNVTILRDEIVFTDAAKTRGWQLTSISPKSFGMPATYVVTLKFLKTTGNFYGSLFVVQSGEKMSNSAADGTLVMGSDLPEGITTPTLENKAGQHLVGSNISTGGRSYVVIDKVNPDSITVREMVTDNNTGVWISPKDPVIGEYAKGSTIAVGSETLEVMDVSADSVTVKLGGVTKTLGPITPDSTRWMLMDMASREQFMIKSADNTILAHLNLNGLLPPIAEGKANLVVYSDVINLKSGDVWGPDPRFLARPET